MDYEQIKEEALKLHSREQRMLIAALAKSRSLYQFKSAEEMCREKINEHLDAIALLGNNDRDKILSKIRACPYPDLRTILFYALHLDGFSSVQISKCTGFSHATVIMKIRHMAEVMEDSRFDQMLFKMYMRFKAYTQKTNTNGERED